MTPEQVKDAHDEIWAVREKADFTAITIKRFPEKENEYFIEITDIYSLFETDKLLRDLKEVNQFLKELK